MNVSITSVLVLEQLHPNFRILLSVCPHYPLRFGGMELADFVG